MKFALLFHCPWPEGSDITTKYKQLIEQVQLGEDLGFHSAWFAEHHFSRFGLGASSLVVLSHIAAKTSKIRLGTAIIIPTLQHPVKVAEDTATLDQLSDGRLDVGFGRGTGQAEFGGYGIDPANARDRFYECVEVIQGLWTTPGYTHHGEYYNMDDVTLVPQPLQKPHPPIYIAATKSQSSLEFAANNGHILLEGAYLDIPEAVDKFQRFQVMSKDAGFPHAFADIPFFRNFFVTEHPERIVEDIKDKVEWLQDMVQWRNGFAVGSDANSSIEEYRRHRAFAPRGFDYVNDHRAVYGDPEYCIDRIEFFQKEGVEYMGGAFAWGGLDHKMIMRSMELFGKKVMPHFASVATTA